MSAAAADAEATARASLDRVEQLQPGHGQVDLFAFLRGTLDQGTAGVGAELEHRIGARGAVFTRGWIGGAWDGDRRSLEADVLAGLRMRW